MLAAFKFLALTGFGDSPPVVQWLLGERGFQMLLGATSSLPQIVRPALVLGSGPNGTPPSDLCEHWALLTVNGSQAGAKHWSTTIPDLTLFGTTVLGMRPANKAAQAALRGLRTRHLLLVRDKSNPLLHNINLMRAAYKYDKLSILDTDDRRAIYASLLGGQLARHAKPSNGVMLAVVALHLGAPRVLMTGFSLTQSGHSYDNSSLHRDHVAADRIVLTEIIGRGLPVFTNDPVFAGESGLPLFAN